jgi:hypothetical protein
MSAAKAAFPVTSGRSSMRVTEAPIPVLCADVINKTFSRRHLAGTPTAEAAVHLLVRYLDRPSHAC